jgi:Ca2+-binding RTX toxin-like protein
MAIINGTINNDNLVGDTDPLNLNDIISGLAGNDILSGGGGNDTLNGGAGNDTLNGGAGADRFVLDSGYSFQIDEDVIEDFRGAQGDRIDVSALGIAELETIRAIAINNIDGSAYLSTNFNGGTTNLTVQGLSLEALTSNNNNFAFSSSNSNDRKQGTAFSDDLFGGFGNDTLIGFDSNNSFTDGDDRLFGEGGDDLLQGGIGSDKLYGGTGVDSFVLDPGYAFQTDDDTVFDFQIGTDKIDVATALDIADFQTLQRLGSNNRLSGTIFSTRTSGGTTNLTIPNITLSQLTAADFRLSQRNANDNKKGSFDVDDLFGGLGNDTLIGIGGDDRLFGEQGNDLLQGGIGSDRYFGGTEADLFVLDPGFAFQTDSDITEDFQLALDKIDVATALDIVDFNTVNSLIGTSGTNNGITTKYGGGSTSLTLSNISAGQLTASDFRFSLRNANDNRKGTSQSDDLFGGKGNDTLSGLESDDRLFGEQGNDVLEGGRGNDFLYGGLGRDIALFSGAITQYSITENADGTITVANTSNNGDGTDVLKGIDIARFTDTDRELIRTKEGADFNGDGRPDILWRNQATGYYSIWLMNGNNFITNFSLTPIPNLNWQMVATADFNNDTANDILWRNQVTGENFVLFMNGISWFENIATASETNLNWQIAGAGDFNNDGQEDILWRNYSASGPDFGKNRIWLMNGTTLTSQVDITPVLDTNWKMIGAGEFNGDAQNDILWRNQVSGENIVWLMNGTTLSSIVNITPLSDINWNAIGVADLNNDKQNDILWRNLVNGSNAVWLMNSTNLVQGILLPSLADPDWKMVV